MKEKVKKTLKIIIKIILAIVLVFAVIIGGIMCYNSIVWRKTQTDIETLTVGEPDFADMDIVSCKFVAHPEMCLLPYLGEVMEYSLSGEMNVTQEYYDELLKKYKWSERSGYPAEQAHQIEESYVYKGLLTFFENETFYYSAEFQKNHYVQFYVCKDRPTIYFFYYET